MELRHLHYFSVVAKQGSVSKAAAVLQMTQPSLSRQIAALEKQVGHPLFERTPRGVALTSAGSGLLIHIEGIFEQVERIPELLETYSQQKELVRIGLPPGIPHPWFRNILDKAAQALPAVEFFLHEVTSDEQRQMLRKGLIDLALLHIEPPEFESALVLIQNMGVAVPLDSGLVSLPHVGFEDLSGIRIMAHTTVSTDKVRMRSAATAAGVALDWVPRAFSQHSELIATTSRVGAIFMTQASSLHYLPNWRWIPVKGTDATGRPLTVETWAAWNQSARSSIAALTHLMATTDHDEGPFT
jgi:DNA-binding transcriptional LysR family regulator